MKVRQGRLPRICNLSALAILPLFFLAGATRTEAQTKAYVVHTNANLVTVIDPANGSVGTISVGTGPTRVVVSRDGTRAYVANGGSDSISVIDTSCPLDETSPCQPVLDTIPVGPGPSALAVTPDGNQLYVMTAAGVVQVVDTATHAIDPNEIKLGASGDIAISPDGSRVYVAAGLVYVINTETKGFISFPAEATHNDAAINSASSVAFSPDAKHAYIGVVTFDLTTGVFRAGGSLLVVDTANVDTPETRVAGTIDLFSLPGAIAFTPDGSRAYVGIQYIWVDTGYGAGFFPGRYLGVIDTITNNFATIIDLGAGGATYSEQNSPDGIGVTADRTAVYAAIPRIGQVAVADVNTNSVTTLISFPSLLTPRPGDLTVVLDKTVALKAYTINAANDTAAATTAGGTALASVLANDQLGGIGVTPKHVTLTQQSSTSDTVALDSTTGAVNVAAGTTPGSFELGYRICEIAAASNCADATVAVTVRSPYVVDAVNDSASTLPGRIALANVLANDTVDGTPAASRVTLSTVSSTSQGITLDAYGSVFVAVGTAPGPHTLTYKICESASPSNCDAADVAITVIPFPIDAVNDTGSALRTGGTAVANVLVNDTFADASATLATVRLSQLATTHAGVSLDVANGAVTVAAGTPAGTHTLRYAICEIATPSNCDEAIVTVAVQHLPIMAVNDYARGSSKSANTVLASVLANDRLNNAPAAGNVSLSLVSLTPASNMIKLDVSDGSVKVLGKTSASSYTLVYEICETAMPVNCARATVTIDLSGGGGGGGKR